MLAPLTVECEKTRAAHTVIAPKTTNSSEIRLVNNFVVSISILSIFVELIHLARRRVITQVSENHQPNCQRRQKKISRRLWPASGLTMRCDSFFRQSPDFRNRPN